MILGLIGSEGLSVSSVRQLHLFEWLRYTFCLTVRLVTRADISGWQISRPTYPLNSLESRSAHLSMSCTFVASSGMGGESCIGNLKCTHVRFTFCFDGEGMTASQIVCLIWDCRVDFSSWACVILGYFEFTSGMAGYSVSKFILFYYICASPTRPRWQGHMKFVHDESGRM